MLVIFLCFTTATELVLDVYCNYIKEGESTEVCLYLTRVSASNVSVILSISGTSPTGKTMYR